MIPLAIIGASGYAAFELIRILLKHPQAKIVMATSRQNESPGLDELHPSLRAKIDLKCTSFDADQVAESASVAFLALPHTASLLVTPSLRKRGVSVIDLSADYRLKNAALYEEWYEHPHTDPEGLSEAVYGLPELFRAQTTGVRLIANPGCYTSTSILGLAPLIAHDLVERKTIIIDAKSGVSGAGRTPKPSTHFPECNESLSAYQVGKHRHTPEINEILGRVGGEPVEVLFTPHLVPMDRGILATIYAQPKRSVTSADLVGLYRSFYAASPFIRVVDRLPSTKDTANTNFCDIAVRLVQGRILIFSCLDNLIKGAAGVAIQNFNLMYGFEETTALWN